MCATQSQTNWTAALIGDTEVILWTMSANQILQRHSTPRNSLPPQQALLTALSVSQINKSDPIQVCGLTQAPAVDVPATPVELETVNLELGGWKLHLLPGLRQMRPTALAEHSTAQIAGFLALNPKWDGVICLPGAITHWVQISAAEVVSFQSAITTGLHDSLSQTLKLPSDWSESALTEAAADTMSRPERLASRLAELHAKALIQSHEQPEGAQESDGTEAAGLLWGYLLGAELAAMRAYWLGQNLALIAPDQLAAPYMSALSAQGLPVTQAKPERMAIEGLIQTWRHRTSAAPTL